MRWVEESRTRVLENRGWRILDELEQQADLIYVNKRLLGTGSEFALASSSDVCDSSPEHREAPVQEDMEKDK